MKKNTLQRTCFILFVADTCNGNGVYRRVYVDGTRCFVKFNGRLLDVTDKEDWFIVG